MEKFAVARLVDIYREILTERQKEVMSLYFDFDLSLAEIAERKSVSRQSVSDLIRRTTEELVQTESKLHLAAMNAAIGKAQQKLRELSLRHPRIAQEAEEIEKILSAVIGP